MTPKLKKNLSTFGKITVSISLIALVFSRLDWCQIFLMFRKIHLFWFLCAIFFFLLSIPISILRFNLFIRKLGIRLSFKTNFQLYMVGLFYNFFIPGGVGGDAYKVYLLNKAYKKSLKKIGGIIFLERFIGVVAIGMIVSALLLFVRFPISYNWNIAASVLGVIGTFVILQLIIRYMTVDKKRIYLVYFYSLLNQLSQLLCVLFVLKSFEIEGDFIIYLLLFFASSVLSVISFAGIGVREAVFYYGAHWFQFNPDVSAGVALWFSILTAVFSFFGVIYIFRKIDV